MNFKPHRARANLIFWRFGFVLIEAQFFWVLVLRIRLFLIYGLLDFSADRSLVAGHWLLTLLNIKVIWQSKNAVTWQNQNIMNGIKKRWCREIEHARTYELAFSTPASRPSSWHLYPSTTSFNSRVERTFDFAFRAPALFVAWEIYATAPAGAFA